MKTILFPTDFSDNSNHAFSYAKSLARAQKAKLILFYTYKLPLVAPVNAFTSREQTLALIKNSLVEAAEKQMKVYTEELDLMDDEYEVIIKEGHVADEIVSFCKRENVDLIVMGTKGESNHRDFLMGSNTVKVSQKTSTLLLAIPEKAPIRPFSKIVFATDLVYNSNRELEKLIDFAKVNDANLTFLHLNLKKQNNSSELKELEAFIQQHSYKKLNLVVADTEDVVNDLIRFLQEGGTDLMVMSNHTKSLYQKLFHKSVSKEMLLHSETPLLIISKEVHPIVFF